MSWRIRLPGCKAGVVLHAALLLHAWPAVAAESTQSCAGLERGPQRTVARVIDGETVALDDGSELRLIGALAPRAIDAGAEPGQWPMEVAAKAELEALALGKSIEIGFGGDRTDRYGRWLGHAFIRQGEERRWVQGQMLEQGLARAYTFSGNRACAESLLASERVARAAERGLWADAAYQARQASTPRELERYRTTFQLIEGRITRVGQGRGTVYLNFEQGRRRAQDRAGRRGFSVSIRRGDLALFGAALGGHAGDAKTLEGRSVRVRGWIEDRNGPVIDLSDGGQLELIEAPAPEGQR